MLLSFSSYIYLILRSGKDKVFFVVVVLCHKQSHIHVCLSLFSCYDQAAENQTDQ